VNRKDGETGETIGRHNQPWDVSRVIDKLNKLNIHCTNTSKQWEGRTQHETVSGKRLRNGGDHSIHGFLALRFSVGNRFNHPESWRLVGSAWVMIDEGPPSGPSVRCLPLAS